MAIQLEELDKQLQILEGEGRILEDKIRCGKGHTEISTLNKVLYEVTNERHHRLFFVTYTSWWMYSY